MCFGCYCSEKVTNHWQRGTCSNTRFHMYKYLSEINEYTLFLSIILFTFHTLTRCETTPFTNRCLFESWSHPFKKRLVVRIRKLNILYHQTDMSFGCYCSEKVVYSFMKPVQIHLSHVYISLRSMNPPNSEKLR